jgi:hypothetical protein
VEVSWSSPRTPRYNDAVESGIRWLNERTEHVALRAGRPSQWRAEDLELARTLTNDLPREATTDAPARGEVYAAQRRMSDEERREFLARLAEEQSPERRARGLALDLPLRRNQEAAITRQAMRRALVALGLLSITKRRVTPTLKRLKAVMIS